MKFEKLVESLNKFQLTEQIFDERELEKKIVMFLKDHGFNVKTQDRVNSEIRNDIVVTFKNGKKICVELKVKADLGVMKQLDNYLPHYKNGIILMCWKASENTRKVFDKVKGEIKTPIALIEVRKNNPMI
jgi:hypothetical protein